MLTSEEKATQLLQELKLLKSEMRGFQRDADHAFERQDETRKAIERRQRKIIFHLGLLQGEAWTVRTTQNLPGFYLTGWSARDHKQLNDLIREDWHYALALVRPDWYSIDLRLDDDEINIQPNGPVPQKDFLEFIDEWGLTIDTSTLGKSIDELREKADNLQSLVDLFK